MRRSCSSWRDSGIEILADVTYQAGDADYTGCISQLLANNPDAIIQYGDSKEMVVFLRQLRQAGYTRCVYTVEGGGDRQLSELAGHASRRHCIFCGICDS